jgi:RNA polymerase sigma-70 factor (ECF subfamily)
LAVDTESYYRTFGPMVLRRCRRLLGDEELARDAMHDVFVKVLRQSDRLDDRAPSSLLYRIATNVCLNKIRAQKRRPEVPGSELIEQIARGDDAGRRSLARGVLERLFGSQPESSGAMAVMHLVDGMTLEEVAEAFSMSVSGVRKRLARLRGELKALEAESP